MLLISSFRPFCYHIHLNKGVKVEVNTFGAPRGISPRLFDVMRYKYLCLASIPEQVEKIENERTRRRRVAFLQKLMMHPDSDLNIVHLFGPMV